MTTNPTSPMAPAEAFSAPAAERTRRRHRAAAGARAGHANPKSEIRNPQLKRRCTRCGRLKPLGRFARDKRCRDGRSAQCKDCHAAYQRQWRRRRPDRPADPAAPKHRRCSRCGRVRPLDLFVKQKYCRYGRSHWCKACHAAYVREWRRRRPDRAYRPPAPKERLCTGCGRVLPLDCFPKAGRGRAKRSLRCRDCHRAQARAWRARHRAELSATARRYRLLWRDKHAARQAAYWAAEAGLIHRPDRCERCGQTPPPNRLHGHHPDYSRPLNVVWLCSLCHAREHRRDLAARKAP
jgi:hypothetical protein